MSGANENKKSLTVKIQLPEDSENILAVNFPNTFSVKSLKDDIAKKFKILSDQLLVFQDDSEIQNAEMLHELNLNDFGIIEIKLTLTDHAINEGVLLDTSVYYSSFTLPDIITVHIPTENEDGEVTTRDLVVEIENKSIKKPFIGGFIHKKTKIEYHHAFTQTGPTFDQIKKVKDSKLCRETQTIELRRSAVETSHDRSTQFFGDANDLLYLQETGDVEKKVNEDYETYEEKEKQKKLLENVLLIQRNFRRYRLKCCIKICAAEYRRLMTIKRKREERIKQDYINSSKKTGNFPRTKKDFDMLFAQIATWKEGKTRRITEEFTGPSRIVEIQTLLEREIQLLNGIEKRRMEIQKEMQSARQDRMLKKQGETVKWIGYKDALVEMDTLRTQRARKLAELFKLLRHPSDNIEDRLKLLNDVSEALRDESSTRIIELENLFQRERDLLMCHLADDSLEVLRQRELVVFMDVIKDEERNKPAKPLCRVCEKCKSAMPLVNFVMHSRQKDYDLCRKCSSLKTSKTDLSVYRAILRGVQRDERRRGSLASLAFIIQETDVKYIIENIWHGISILSQCSVTSDLRLPRWNIDEDWSPWNCICLTDTESRIHVICSDLQLIYGEKITKECLSKHSLAMSTFKHLKKMESAWTDKAV